MHATSAGAMTVAVSVNGSGGDGHGLRADGLLTTVPGPLPPPPGAPASGVTDTAGEGSPVMPAADATTLIE